MLELLNGVGKTPAAYYPNSGPGSKYLEYGDENFGLFGEVSSTELMTSDELSAGLDFYKGTAIAGNITWLKYIYQNRVCFTPKKELRHSLSWNDLYDAGLVYGVDGLGAYPNGAGVNQLRVITKGSTFFKVRLFSISPVDPAPVYSGTYPEQLRASEWFTFLPPLLNYVVTGYTGDVWNLYSPSDLTHSMSSHVQETRDVYNTYNICISATITNPSTTIKTIISADYGWRPVLEIVDGSGLVLEHYPVYFDADGLLPVGGIDHDASDIVALHESVAYQSGDLVTVGVTDPTFETTAKLHENPGLVYLDLYPIAHTTHSIT